MASAAFFGIFSTIMLSRSARLGQSLFVLAVVAMVSVPSPGRSQEFRALWVDAWNSGLHTGSQISQLVADARAGNFNALVVQIRRRGDSLYNSSYEPKIPQISSGFDPLADLVAKAHNTSTGPRIEVHAWIVSYNIWANATTNGIQPTHPLVLHPDWLTQNSSGAQWDGDNYAFDPGHPAVQEHTYNVAMDIVSRYDVDGLNFDYIRYAGNTWGYNPVSVARFNQRFNRTGQPGNTDAQWLQFRRDQVSTLVRKVYLNTIAIKPDVKISADTICFAPGPTSPSDWTSTAAYTSVLQDWRAWMEEGILDLNIPMAYFDQRRWASAWTNWSVFAKDHRYGRHLAMGPGIYLNTMSNVLFQMRHTRLPSPGGNYADGVCGYSYAVPVTNDTPASVFFNALVLTNIYETNTVPIFATPVSTPVMPWKSSPTRGHVKGFVFNGTNGAGFDGATVFLTGPTNRVLLTDATGFFGAVDLPLGNYTLLASNASFAKRTNTFTATAGVVSTRDFTLPLPSSSGLFDVSVAAGGTAAIISWSSTNPSTTQVEYGLTTNLGLATYEDPTPVTNHVMLLAGLLPRTNYFFTVVSRAGTNVHRSGGWSFSTVPDVILDNGVATYSGSWQSGTISLDKYGADYRYATVASNTTTASALYYPNVTVKAGYDVSLWYPQGGNRTTNALINIIYSGGTLAARVNQQANGGRWVPVGTNLTFRPGQLDGVRISNFTGQTGDVVMADAVRLSYNLAQDKPAGSTTPDWWTQFYFGTSVSPLLDSDGDGIPNWAEYLAGTAPNSPASRLNFRLDAVNPALLQATFNPHLPDRLYQLERCTNFGAGWQILSNATPAALGNGSATFTLPNGPEPLNFYRLKISWMP